jgi:tagatose 1,6-diphosphate aldolase GatY/KbaY
MLVRFSELLAEAGARHGALGAFTCYNLEQALGVLEAAAERERGVVLLVSGKRFCAPGGHVLLSALVAAARTSPAKTCVELDHVKSIEPVRQAFALGAGAVMADGSKLTFEENVAFVRDAVALGALHGGEVEAELGGIEGDEDIAAAATAGPLTDPDEASAFVGQAGIACLAVSVGNVHGAYREPPLLDWERLSAIRERVPCSLSLHGASGLPEGAVSKAIALGVTKVNANTELRERYLSETATRIASVREGARLLELNLAQAEAVKEAVSAMLDTFENQEFVI